MSPWIVIIVVALLAIAGYWYWSRGQASAPPITDTPASTSTPAVSQKTNILPSGSSSENAALNQDLNAIDGQLSSFSADSASVDSSLADKPVQQSSL